MGKPSFLSPFKAIRYLFKKPKTLRYPFEPKENLPKDTGGFISMIGKNALAVVTALIYTRMKQSPW